MSSAIVVWRKIKVRGIRLGCEDVIGGESGMLEMKEVKWMLMLMLMRELSWNLFRDSRHLI